jgi:hypothetical protein
MQGGSNMTGTDVCKQAAQVPVMFEPPYINRSITGLKKKKKKKRSSA